MKETTQTANVNCTESMEGEASKDSPTLPTLVEVDRTQMLWFSTWPENIFELDPFSHD